MVQNDGYATTVGFITTMSYTPETHDTIANPDLTLFFIMTTTCPPIRALRYLGLMTCYPTINPIKKRMRRQATAPRKAL